MVEQIGSTEWFDEYVKTAADMLEQMSPWQDVYTFPGFEPDPDMSVFPLNTVKINQILAVKTISMRNNEDFDEVDENSDGPVVWAIFVLCRTGTRVFVMMESSPSRAEVYFDWREVRASRKSCNGFSVYDTNSIVCNLINQSSEWVGAEEEVEID